MVGGPDWDTRITEPDYVSDDIRPACGHEDQRDCDELCEGMS